MTWVGLSVLIAAAIALSEGTNSTGAYGIVLGIAIVVFSEWNRWRSE